MSMDRRIREILSEVKKLAREYYELTRKPLGITGEVAEYEAARLLDLQLMPARHTGSDAVGRNDLHYQIKGRRLLPDSKPGQRIGSIDIEKKFDAVLMVLLNENYDATEIYEVEHGVLRKAEPQELKHGFPVRKFKKIGRRVWPRANP